MARDKDFVRFFHGVFGAVIARARSGLGYHFLFVLNAQCSVRGGRGELEWWSNGVMTRTATPITPSLHYSSTPFNRGRRGENGGIELAMK
jgi:hypothetical protein